MSILRVRICLTHQYCTFQRRALAGKAVYWAHELRPGNEPKLDTTSKLAVLAPKDPDLRPLWKRVEAAVLVSISAEGESCFGSNPDQQGELTS